jgi:hypothetical protein
MALPTTLTSVANLRLAFQRIVRGANRDYKQYIRHLLPGYKLSLDANLGELSSDLRNGRYHPEEACRVYQPKKSGILRPITILSLRDQIVYQAILNVIAAKFESRQRRYAYRRCFGAIFAGTRSDFFYESWKRSYSQYNEAIKDAFEDSYHWVADFDLVSFYELIDHKLLGWILRKRVRSPELLELLFRCLQSWTPRAAGGPVHHGIPQGPECSAFLAECLLFYMDRQSHRDVVYLRYIDDVKIMGRDEVPVRRALIRLDLLSKTLGLVPQAQKIDCRKAKSLKEIRKSVPSGILHEVGTAPMAGKTQRGLLQILRRAVSRKKHGQVEDVTCFKYALAHLRPRRDILRKLVPIISSRPDLSWALSRYMRAFPSNKDVAKILCDALAGHPLFDATAANYIDALDVCEPSSKVREYRECVRRVVRNSVERTGLLRLAANAFKGRRSSVKVAAGLVDEESMPLFKSLLCHRLFGEHPDAPFRTSQCVASLKMGVCSRDADYARYCAYLLAVSGLWDSSLKSSSLNRTSQMLAASVGLRKRVRAPDGVLATYFNDRMQISLKFPWQKGFGTDYKDAEKRCLRLQGLEGGDPTVWTMCLDTFNEVLVQAFSQRHPALAAKFVAVAKAKNKAVPEYGYWLYKSPLPPLLPKGIKWLQQVHSLRVKADLAHAKDQKTGKPTRQITFSQAEKLKKDRKIAWAELLGLFSKIV